mmetsp:Transcript_61987/g.145801  ORF Transcript_61987/g.145801 Transcript_61987/m.145801 type:complete len:203 (+) Transcript_61987:467-1075(+)
MPRSQDPLLLPQVLLRPVLQQPRQRQFQRLLLVSSTSSPSCTGISTLCGGRTRPCPAELPCRRSSRTPSCRGCMSCAGSHRSAGWESCSLGTWSSASKCTCSTAARSLLWRVCCTPSRRAARHAGSRTPRCSCCRPCPDHPRSRCSGRRSEGTRADPGLLSSECAFCACPAALPRPVVRPHPRGSARRMTDLGSTEACFRPS